MAEAVYNSKKCGSFCHTIRHFNASQMYVIKDQSIDLKFWYVIFNLTLPVKYKVIRQNSKFLLDFSKPLNFKN